MIRHYLDMKLRFQKMKRRDKRYSHDPKWIERVDTNIKTIEGVIAELEELEALLKPKLCNTCTRDHCGCSIQDSISQIEPEATFDTFGCVHHEFNALLTEPSKHSTIQH